MSGVSKDILADSRSMGESRDCAVIATAEVLMIPYKEAHSLLKKFGRKDREGTLFSVITKPAIESLGFDVTEVVGYSSISPEAIAGQFGRKKLTVNMIEKNNMFNEGHYLIRVNRHILAMVDGVVKDWTTGRKHYVNSIHKVG